MISNNPKATAIIDGGKISIQIEKESSSKELKFNSSQNKEDLENEDSKENLLEDPSDEQNQYRKLSKTIKQQQQKNQSTSNSKSKNNNEKTIEFPVETKSLANVWISQILKTYLRPMRIGEIVNQAFENGLKVTKYQIALNVFTEFLEEDVLKENSKFIRFFVSEIQQAFYGLKKLKDSQLYTHIGEKSAICELCSFQNWYFEMETTFTEFSCKKCETELSVPRGILSQLQTPSIVDEYDFPNSQLKTQNPKNIPIAKIVQPKAKTNNNEENSKMLRSWKKKEIPMAPSNPSNIILLDSKKPITTTTNISPNLSTTNAFQAPVPLISRKRSHSTLCDCLILKMKTECDGTCSPTSKMKRQNTSTSTSNNLSEPWEIPLSTQVLLAEEQTIDFPAGRSLSLQSIIGGDVVGIGNEIMNIQHSNLHFFEFEQQQQTSHNIQTSSLPQREEPNIFESQPMIFTPSSATIVGNTNRFPTPSTPSQQSQEYFGNNGNTTNVPMFQGSEFSVEQEGKINQFAQQETKSFSKESTTSNNESPKRESKNNENAKESPSKLKESPFKMTQLVANPSTPNVPQQQNENSEHLIAEERLTDIESTASQSTNNNQNSNIHKTNTFSSTQQTRNLDITTHCMFLCARSQLLIEQDSYDHYKAIELTSALIDFIDKHFEEERIMQPIPTNSTTSFVYFIALALNIRERSLAAVGRVLEAGKDSSRFSRYKKNNSWMLKTPRLSQEEWNEVMESIKSEISAQNDNFKSSELKLQESLRKFPNNTFIRSRLAIIFESKKEFEKANIEYGKISLHTYYSIYQMGFNLSKLPTKLKAAADLLSNLLFNHCNDENDLIIPVSDLWLVWCQVALFGNKLNESPSFLKSCVAKILIVQKQIEPCLLKSKEIVEMKQNINFLIELVKNA